MPSTRPSAAPPINQADAVWVDGKRWAWLMGPALPLLTLLCLGAWALLGWTWALALMPLLLFGLIPVLDVWIGLDPSNPPAQAMAALEADPYYERLVLLSVPLQVAVTVLGAWCASHLPTSPWVWLGLVVSVGAMNGFGINTGHELGHKHVVSRRWWAKLALAPAAYGHFFVEHNRGHHRNVATPTDPASARMGESFWRFLPRSVLGSLASAWRLEAVRLAAAGKSPWHWSNHNLQAWSLTALLFGGLTAWLGGWALVFLAAQAVYAFSLLEVVNYLEHYGLLRQGDAQGGYVRCSPEHSWNSNNVVTNLLLFQLQRHSDHHAHPARSYQALRHFDSSPQLPTGYASMLLLAYVPPLWFSVMDPRVAAHYGCDLGRANLQPAQRERLWRRYHRGPAAVTAL